jgi:hypothetical protein
LPAARSTDGGLEHSDRAQRSVDLPTHTLVPRRRRRVWHRHGPGLCGNRAAHRHGAEVLAVLPVRGALARSVSRRRAGALRDRGLTRGGSGRHSACRRSVPDASHPLPRRCHLRVRADRLRA